MRRRFPRRERPRFPVPMTPIRIGPSFGLAGTKSEPSVLKLARKAPAEAPPLTFRNSRRSMFSAMLSLLVAVDPFRP
jgi:hypothetical protein